MKRRAANPKEPLRLAVVAASYPGDAIFDGIRAFLEEHSEWQLLKSPRGFTHRPEHVSSVAADGYIVFAVLSPDRRDALLRKGKPVVNCRSSASGRPIGCGSPPGCRGRGNPSEFSASRISGPSRS